MFPLQVIETIKSCDTSTGGMAQVRGDKPEVFYEQRKVGAAQVMVLKRIVTTFHLPDGTRATLHLESDNGKFSISTRAPPEFRQLFEYVGTTEARDMDDALDLYNQALKSIPAMLAKQTQG